MAFFGQGLQGEARDHAVPADGLVVDVGHLDLDVAAVAVLLDGKVIVQQAQLILKGDQLLGALGNALGQTGKGGDHLGDAGGAFWMVAIQRMELRVL